MVWIIIVLWGIIILAGALCCLVSTVSTIKDIKSKTLDNHNYIVALILLVFVFVASVGLYFFIDSEVDKCPECSTVFMSEDNSYCSNCGFAFVPTCGECYHKLDDADLYCSRCGNAVKKGSIE